MRSRLLKKAHLLRWRPWPHAQRTGSTPRVRPAGAASHLGLFEQPPGFSASCPGRCERIPPVLMMRRAGFLLASGVWLTFYVVCVLLVTSFIFFEVLDVDGSDFPTHPTKMAVRLPESHHDDLKRLWLQQPVKIWTGDAILEIERPERSDRDVPAMASPRPPIRQHRAALPRAALVDVPPSA